MQRLAMKPSRLLLATAGLAVSGMLAATSPAAAQNKMLTIVLQEEPGDFDLCQAMRSAQGRILRQNVGEALTKINPTDGTVTPLLATSWQQVNDKTWRFNLRQGVKYHDGSPFNADSVVKAIKRTYDEPKLFCENRSKSGIKTGSITAKAVDANTVEISLDVPAPILPVVMGNVTMTHPAAPTDAFQTTKPIGTGPYVFDSFTTGQDVNLVRNPNYWGKQPEVEKARYIYRKESAVRAAMVKVGEADIAPTITAEDATDPSMDSSYLNSETTRLRIEAQVPPLNDKRVRLALNHAIDRKALQGSVFSKNELMATQHVVPSIAGHNHEIDKKVWAYDPVKAKALLAEAKKDGVPVDAPLLIVCRLNQWPGAQEAQEANMAYFKAIGLNVSLKCIDGAEHSKMNRKPYDASRGPILFQDMHDNNNGDAVFTVFTKYGCDGEQSTICSKELDAVVAKATAMPTGPERVKLFQEAFRMIYEDIVADVPLFHMVGYTRVGKRINYKPSITTNTEVELATIGFK